MSLHYDIVYMHQMASIYCKIVLPLRLKSLFSVEKLLKWAVGGLRRIKYALSQPERTFKREKDRVFVSSCHVAPTADPKIRST